MLDERAERLFCGAWDGGFESVGVDVKLITTEVEKIRIGKDTGEYVVEKVSEKVVDGGMIEL